LGNTARLFERILADKPHPEMGYRGCLGIIRLADQYSPARMEAVAGAGIAYGSLPFHASVQTTERYLGTKQDLLHAPNDAIKLRVTV
jgi:hypothetical protein